MIRRGELGKRELPELPEDAEGGEQQEHPEAAGKAERGGG